MKIKYDSEIDTASIKTNLKRLTNQIYKLLPNREEGIEWQAPYDKGNPAIVVNNQLSEKVTDKAMTGVGITYKFTKLLDRYYGVNYADDYLDLVALGMIGDRADTMNLQTRYLILDGLKQIREKTNNNKLIRTLVDAQMYSMEDRKSVV